MLQGLFPRYTFVAMIAVASSLCGQTTVPIAKDDVEMAEETESIGSPDAAATDSGATTIKATEENPSINDVFIDPDLDVEAFLDRFEVESREVYAARDEIVAACQLKAGMSVADIGAGTGFFSKMFSRVVGDRGWVYAVEISPKFLTYINQQMKAGSISNVTGVFCREDSTTLPPKSIDVAFVCDTYHHFEFVEETLASIHRALRDDGVLVVVDFKRIPGESREWVLSHVRAGQSTVREEIEAAGFGFVDEVTIPELKENYVLLFKKR